MAIQNVLTTDFVTGSDVLLTNWTPSVIGIGFTPLSGNVATNATVAASDNSLTQPFDSSFVLSDYIINVTQPQSDEQEIEQTVGSLRTAYILLQGQNGTTGNNGYRVKFTGATNNISIYRVDEGVETVLDTDFANNIVDGAVVKAKITATGDISVYIDGVIRTLDGGATFVNDTTYTGGWGGWVGLKSYTDGGITNFNAAIDVAGGPVPSGIATVGTVTPTETTASVAYSYDAADETGYKYRLDGGAAVDIGVTNPFVITGLTQNTGYTVEVLAYNANGDGAWSTPTTNFTTDAAAIPSITTEPLKNNTGQLLINEVGVIADVYNTSTGALVVRKTGLTSNASGIVTFTDALMSAATEYRIVITLAASEEGIARITTV